MRSKLTRILVPVKITSHLEQISCIQLIQMENKNTNEYYGGIMNERHITRFTYKFTNFQGWRVAISRQGITLARYFSDKQHGDPATAREHALRFRDHVLEELRMNPDSTREILERHRVKPKKLYPAGLKPCASQQDAEVPATEQKVGACSMRSNRVMQGILKDVCRRFQLDTASVLKLSLYLFALQYSDAADMEKGIVMPQALHAKAIPGADEWAPSDDCLQRIVEQLESRAALAGMPSFEEFSTGKGRAVRPMYGEIEQRGADPPQVEPQPPVRSMRSPRPSPPQAVSAHCRKSTSLSTPTFVPPGLVSHRLKPESFTTGTEPIALPPPDYY